MKSRLKTSSIVAREIIKEKHNGFCSDAEVISFTKSN